MPLLQVNNLSVEFSTRKGTLYAVNGVSFSLERNSTLCIVGESGSGKSVTATSLLRLLDKNAKITTGEMLFTTDGKTVDLLALTERNMRKIRGNRISMIFQEPMIAFSPMYTIGNQINEATRLHITKDKKKSKEISL